MKITKSLLATIVAAAFGAGLGIDHVVTLAKAASPPLTPQFINLIALQAADLASTRAGPETVLASIDAGLVKVQVGTRGRHSHADADEIQYVIEGTGSEWFVDKTVSLKPGDLLIIPKGTPHAGTTDGLKILTIQMPFADPKNTVRIP